MTLIIKWLVSTVAILITDYILPGVSTSGIVSALIFALVLGILNAVLKPLLVILTLPINVVTLGLFTLVINALVILLASAIVPGFVVVGFWWAVLFGIVLALVMMVLNRVVDEVRD
jgi:putative membrane protein